MLATLVFGKGWKSFEHVRATLVFGKGWKSFEHVNPHPTSGQHWFSGKVGNHVKPSSNIGQHWFSGKVGKVLNMLNQSIPSQFPEQVKMKTKMDHG
jgi:hypothetical protein